MDVAVFMSGARVLQGKIRQFQTATAAQRFRLLQTGSSCWNLKSAQSQVNQTTDKLKWSYVHGASSSPLLGVTVGQQLQQTTEKFPDREMVVFTQLGYRRTYQQFLEECDTLPAGFLKLGIKKGDRVGIWSPNYPEWPLVQYATARAGIILVNINQAYQAQEVEFVLRKVGAKALVAAEGFSKSDYYDIISQICPELNSAVAGDLNSSRLPDLKTVIFISEKKYPGVLRVSDVMEAGGPAERSAVQDMLYKLQFDEPINIQFTSGTTGLPKGATLSHHNIVNNANFVGQRLQYHNKVVRIAVPVPMYHCFGMVLASLSSVVHGGACIYPCPTFEPDATLKACDQEKCNSLYGTPTMFIDMLNHPNFPRYDYSSVYAGMMGGSSCPIEIMKKVSSLMNMHQLTIAYGATENSPLTFLTLPDDTLEKQTETVGRPLHHVEAKVVDSAGHIVPVGTPGEACTRGYMVMLGYWDNEEKTREVIGQDRWYKTGDQAIMTEDGYLKIVGRIKDIIIRGGENIYPVEIEQFLYQHPKIADAQVIGVPDKRVGEEVCVWIKLKKGETLTEDEVKEFCKGKIAHFKIPRYITFVEGYPLTTSGKVQKYKMREQVIKTLGLEGVQS